MQRVRAIGRGALFDECDCYVIDGGTRMLSERSLVQLLSGGQQSGELSPYLKRLPARYAYLAERGTTVMFADGRTDRAVDVEAVTAICAAFDEADEANELDPDQHHLARNARRVLRSAAKVGLTALVDEAAHATANG